MIFLYWKIGKKVDGRDKYEKKILLAIANAKEQLEQREEYKIIDSKILLEEISQQEYDYILSFGQKPNIKDKIYLETTARNADSCINKNIWEHIVNKGNGGCNEDNNKKSSNDNFGGSYSSSIGVRNVSADCKCIFSSIQYEVVV